MARDIVETVKVFDEGADPHEFSVRLTYARKLLEEDSGPAGLEVRARILNYKYFFSSSHIQQASWKSPLHLYTTKHTHTHSQEIPLIDRNIDEADVVIVVSCLCDIQ